MDSEDWTDDFSQAVDVAAAVVAGLIRINPNVAALQLVGPLILDALGT